MEVACLNRATHVLTQLVPAAYSRGQLSIGPLRMATGQAEQGAALRYQISFPTSGASLPAEWRQCSAGATQKEGGVKAPRRPITRLKSGERSRHDHEETGLCWATKTIHVQANLHGPRRANVLIGWTGGAVVGRMYRKMHNGTSY